mmetsp:Transcript_8814/g.23723  ORF Transcript_8814/g.23723 Transcript_8814/m.23723 type:complete len:290 (-) Transcript_8814:151-1020(-)
MWRWRRPVAALRRKSVRLEQRGACLRGVFGNAWAHRAPLRNGELVHLCIAQRASRLLRERLQAVHDEYKVGGGHDADEATSACVPKRRTIHAVVVQRVQRAPHRQRCVEHHHLPTFGQQLVCRASAQALGDLLLCQFQRHRGLRRGHGEGVWAWRPRLLLHLEARGGGGGGGCGGCRLWVGLPVHPAPLRRGSCGCRRCVLHARWRHHVLLRVRRRGVVRPFEEHPVVEVSVWVWQVRPRGVVSPLVVYDVLELVVSWHKRYDNGEASLRGVFRVRFPRERHRLGPCAE